jgi:isoamylase
MLRFVRELIALRKRHPNLQRRRFLTGTRPEGTRFVDIQWHGEQLESVCWKDQQSRSLAFTLGDHKDDKVPLHAMFNMSEEPRSFEVPALDNLTWYRVVDTARASPGDISRPGQQVALRESRCLLAPRSVVVMEGFD